MKQQKEWLNFLREQYPKGSRIRLREMKDPYDPVEPGTMGTLNCIDAIGTFHCTWDNGRTLGLVIGEDSFTVLPPEPKLLKLYMPMTVTYCERNEWGDLEDDEMTMDDRDAVSQVDHIAAALLRERRPEEGIQGLMKYYNGNDGVSRKVKSYDFTAEVRDGKLWGVAECQVIGELTSKELTALMETVTGQASDGLGEGFEQREIRIDDGRELYAHLWQWDNWSIHTEQELFAPKFAEGLPELCFSTLPDTGALICIKRGESGYYKSDWSTDSREENQKLADYNNERLGVTPAQRQAMEIGSMHGWNVPGADPKAYEPEEPKMGGMTLA